MSSLVIKYSADTVFEATIKGCDTELQFNHGFTELLDSVGSEGQAVICHMINRFVGCDVGLESEASKTARREQVQQMVDKAIQTLGSVLPAMFGKPEYVDDGEVAKQELGARKAALHEVVLEVFREMVRTGEIAIMAIPAPAAQENPPVTEDQAVPDAPAPE